MGKLLFWIVVAAVVFGGYRFMQILERKSAAAAARRPAEPDKRELILACAHCGVYVPTSDAIMDGEQAYCSQEHRRLGQDSNPESRKDSSKER